MTEGAKTVKAREDFRRGNSPSSIWPLLWDLAVEEKYDISDRRLWDHAKVGHVIGISYQDGQWIIEGEPRSLIGPVPAGTHTYVMAKGATGVAVQLASGSPVSSQIWVKQIGKRYFGLESTTSGAWAAVSFQRV